MVTDLETCFVSVERCSAFEAIEPELSYTNFAKEEKKMIKLGTSNDLIKESKFAPPLKVHEYQIIKEGHVQFTNVSARYPAKEESV